MLLAENRHSNSYLLFLLCTIMYLRIPINNSVSMEVEDRHSIYNQNINYFMSIIIRSCKNKTSRASAVAGNDHSNSYFLLLPCTFVYLRIPINDPIGTESEGRCDNVQPNQKPNPNGHVLLTLDSKRVSCMLQSP